MLCSGTAEQCFKPVKHEFLFEDYNEDMYGDL